MRILADTLHIELDIEQTLAAQAEFRTAVWRKACALPEAAVGLEFGCMGLDDPLEVRTTHLLLTLDKVLYRDRQFAKLRAQRLDGDKARGDLTFVIANTAGVELAVAHCRLEWCRVPEVKWLRRLDIIVIIKQDGIR